MKREEIIEMLENYADEGNEMVLMISDHVKNDVLIRCDMTFLADRIFDILEKSNSVSTKNAILSAVSGYLAHNPKIMDFFLKTVAANQAMLQGEKPFNPNLN